MKIYENYDDEPEDIFSPLPEKLYCDLYDLEMCNFPDDINFYLQKLPENCSILELGCGTGRIATSLAAPGRAVTGIDHSLYMLKKAVSKTISGCNYIGMDMRRLSFTIQFDAIIIPYNTLNLLYRINDITSCLTRCRSLLRKNGRIYLQLFIPDKKLTCHRGKIFQFQIFDKPEGGKIIKEILREYSSESQSISVEERYRIRPMKKGFDDQNFNHFFTIAAFPVDKWTSLFLQAGLQITDSWGDYDLHPFQPGSSTLFLASLAI
ncbi:MAG: class I SAM-dependent methyltransferase [Deltaproteobacteria bacterium]|nr:class I SAM-dependent methyltransferase [Deltaproteobacteria bacterium]MBW2658212.1 class I SAM-dependent methyltransferase [Deltaproteobacteria bacterium]